SILFISILILLFNCSKDNDIEEEVIIPKVYEGNIQLNSQDDIDNFGKEGYTSVSGYIVISSLHNNSIKNLNALSKLNSVGSLSIIYTDIVDLNGLQNLEFVKERLEIEFNDLLISTKGLNKITTIGKRLIIDSNPKLTNIDAFSNLNQTIGGLYIKSCSSLKDVDVFKKITRIEEELIIEG